MRAAILLCIILLSSSVLQVESGPLKSLWRVMSRGFGRLRGRHPHCGPMCRNGRHSALGTSMRYRVRHHKPKNYKQRPDIRNINDQGNAVVEYES